MDIVSPEKRSRMMAGIKSKNTKPELIVRKELFRRGFRYRLHNRGLPGKPDLTLAKYNTVIFVNGCFWHKHDCHLFKWPKTRRAFWRKKIMGNVQRDQKNHELLGKKGWHVITFWECSIKNKTDDEINLQFDKLAELLLNKDNI